MSFNFSQYAPDYEIYHRGHETFNHAYSEFMPWTYWRAGKHVFNWCPRVIAVMIHKNNNMDKIIVWVDEDYAHHVISNYDEVNELLRGAYKKQNKSLLGIHEIETLTDEDIAFINLVGVGYKKIIYRHTNLNAEVERDAWEVVFSRNPNKLAYLRYDHHEYHAVMRKDGEPMLKNDKNYASSVNSILVNAVRYTPRNGGV